MAAVVLKQRGKRDKERVTQIGSNEHVQEIESEREKEREREQVIHGDGG